MTSIFAIENLTNNNINYSITSILSLIIVFFGISTYMQKNPIIALLFLIGLFFSIALYLAIIGLTFLSLAYLLVYIGAISILFLFVLMLINIKISDLYLNTNNNLILIFIITLILTICLTSLLPNFNLNSLNTNYTINYLDIFTDKVMYITNSSWEINSIYIHQISSIGNIMFTVSSIFILIISLILLLAMVGSIIITIDGKELYEQEENKDNSSSKF